MIGVHRNQGGTTQTIAPVGEYVARLRDAGLRAFVVVIGEGGHAAQLSDAGALVAFAIDSWRAAPAYDSGDAHGDAAQRWATIKEMIPAEIAARRDDIWLIILNEPDRARAPYVFRFMLHIAQLANADGYKVCGPNYSSGTPEVDAWETPEGLAWLRYCGENPDMARIATHEYSLDTADIRTGYPWLVGRFQFVQDVCDDHGIPQPKWLICECGWSYNSMPDAESALAQVPFLHATYGEIDVALWTLGAWSSGPDLPPKLAAFMPHLTDWLIANVEPPDEEPPMIDWRAEIIAESKQRQHATGIRFNPDFAFIKWMVANGYSPAHKEGSHVTGDGVPRALQGAIDLTGERQRVTLTYVKPWAGMGNVEFLYDAPLFVSPVGTIDERASGNIWPGAWQDANPYGNRYPLGGGFSRHTGADLNLNLPSWNTDKGMPAYAMADGIVTYARRVPTGTWGRLVVVRHETPLGVHHSRCGHLATMLVEVGQEVRQGDVLGTIGGAEFGLPDHLHFDVSHSGILQTDPTHWPGDNLAQVHAHYLPPKTFLEAQGKADGGQTDPPPPAPTIDLRRFKIAHPDCWRVVKHVAPTGHETNEDVQDLMLQDGIFVRRKNQNAEWHRLDSQFFYLIHDTSPSPGSNGVARVYALYKNGVPGAPKSLLQQRIGEPWVETGKHLVQFRARSDCRELSENSGESQNRSVITRYETNYTFNRYGQNLHFDEVVWEQTGAETQIYGRVDGKSCGWIGWSAPWGDSEPVEVYWDRGRMTQEPDRVCGW